MEARECFEKFVQLIRPFRGLWNSARVTTVAVSAPGERKGVSVRVVLREEELPKRQPFQIVTSLEPTPEVLVAEVDFAKSIGEQILFKAISEYRIDLETAETFDRVFLRWPLSHAPGTGQPAQFSAFSWHEPFRYESSAAKNQFGEDRTCITLIGMGDYIRTIMPDQLSRNVSSKLRLLPPDHFDGIAKLYEKLLPGLKYDSGGLRVVQVIFPLPFDLEQREDGNLTLQAPIAARQQQMEIIGNYQPESATRIRILGDAASPAANGQKVEWSLSIPWPKGAESGKASLYYAGEEVATISLQRWPGAGTLRAAVDFYFDPEHKRLRAALFGETKESSKSQAFEMAVVRLMNLLGSPLVWYGKGASEGRRNDAAGVVGEKRERIVVLAECTVEKPEEKFSALRDRIQKLTESLRGGAEVLAVVFTQADPPQLVFDAAAEHGIALVGSKELRQLFEMLSVTAAEEDVLGFLNKQKSPLRGIL